MANGTLYLLPGRRVEGDILVVGGRLIRSEQVEHFGPRAGATGMRRRCFATRKGGWRCASGAARSASWPRRAPRFQTGRVRTTLSLATGGTYNRIEGLPIRLRPDVRAPALSRGRYARLDLRGILRTAGEGSRAEQRLRIRAPAPISGFQGKPEFGVGGRLYSEVDPIEDQPFRHAEIGWSAFLLQRDYRD